jgi:hypothetical protein
MSSTIPFIFPYLELDGDPVTDGGLVTNMVDIFPRSPRPVVGLRPRSDYGIKRAIQDVKVSKLFIWNYLKVIAEFFMDSADNIHIPHQDWLRTIIIPTYNIGSFNFEIKEEDITQLIQYGYTAVMTSELVRG